VKGAFGPKIDKFFGRVVMRGKGGGPKGRKFQELYGQTAASTGANSPGLLPRVTAAVASTLQSRYASKLNFILSDPNASAALGT